MSLPRWFGRLHLGQLVMIELVLAALCMAALLGAAVTAANYSDAKRHILRSTDFARYEAEREDTLGHAELWERKYAQWYDQGDAAIYVAKRPGYDGPQELADNAAVVLRDYERRSKVNGVLRVVLLATSIGALGVMFAGLWWWFGARASKPPAQAV